MPEIETLVAGSLNIDLVVQAPRFPEPGETIQGEDLQTIPGGKGSNQAAAAARQGLKTALIGRVGDDAYGKLLLSRLEHLGVNTSQIKRDSQAATGSAVIIVNRSGENSIVLSPGANANVSASDLDQAEELFQNAELLLLQLEIPLPTVTHAAQLGKRNGLRVILNPAPAAELPTALLEAVDILVPNETELALLSGQELDGERALEEAARSLLERGPQVVIVTLGSRGAMLVTRKKVSRIPVREVEVVDTTAAGDAFIGGLASGLQQNLALENAVQYANCAGALATTKFGAQPSLPTREEVESFYHS